MCHRVSVGRSRRPCALGCRGSPGREKRSRGAHGHAGREARPARRRCCGGLPSRPLCDRRPAAAVRAPSGPGCRRTPPRCRTDSRIEPLGDRGPAERPSGAGCPAVLSCGASVTRFHLGGVPAGARTGPAGGGSRAQQEGSRRPARCNGESGASCPPCIPIAPDGQLFPCIWLSHESFGGAYVPDRPYGTGHLNLLGLCALPAHISQLRGECAPGTHPQGVWQRTTRVRCSVRDVWRTQEASPHCPAWGGGVRRCGRTAADGRARCRGGDLSSALAAAGRVDTADRSRRRDGRRGRRCVRRRAARVLSRCAGRQPLPARPVHGRRFRTGGPRGSR